MSIDNATYEPIMYGKYKILYEQLMFRFEDIEPDDVEENDEEGF